MRFAAELWKRYSVDMGERLPVQLVKFCFVGSLNTLTTFFTYILLTRTLDFFFVHYLIAEALAYFAGTVLSFILNRHWTFQKSLEVDFLEIVRFYATILSGLAINLAALAALVELFSLYDIIAVAVSLFLTAAWNFLLMKFWVFPSAKRPIEEKATADRIR